MFQNLQCTRRRRMITD